MKPEALLKLYKAMKLEAYPEPPVLDRKRELEASTERTRFGQPVAYGWTCAAGNKTDVTMASFTPTSIKDLAFYRTELDALMAARNALALDAATKLAKLDRQIVKLLAGTAPNVEPVDIVAADVQAETVVVTPRKAGKSAALAAMYDSNPPEKNSYAAVFKELRDAGLTPTGRTAKEPEPQDLPKPEARLTGFAERMKAAREAKKQKGYD